MKKIWLLSLLICGLFLFGCQKQAESEIKVKEETTVELTAFDKSQLTEKEKQIDKLEKEISKLKAQLSAAEV